ncbi:MAG: hypothetical protein Kow0067_14980 [Coriobacteriia bacterium]
MKQPIIVVKDYRDERLMAPPTKIALSVGAAVLTVALIVVLFTITGDRTPGEAERAANGDLESATPTDVPANMPEIVDEPSPPDIIFKLADANAGTESATEPLDSNDPAFRDYVDETAGIVTDGSDEIRAVVETVLDALETGNVAALDAALAPDESLPAGYAESLIARYPRIDTGEAASSVNVFAIGRATVYMAYGNVEWEDGGLRSGHTIAIPLRFVHRTWYISGIQANAEGMTFVQTIELTE